MELVSLTLRIFNIELLVLRIFCGRASGTKSSGVCKSVDMSYVCTHAQQLVVSPFIAPLSYDSGNIRPASTTIILAQ